MNKYVSLCFSAAFVLVLMNCSSTSYKSDYDPSKDFSKYKTYAWFTENIEGDALAADPLTKKRIMGAVDKVIQARGGQLVESDPDVMVVVHAGVKERMNVTQTGGGYYGGWYGPGWGGYGGTTHVSYYDEGTLVIDFVDYAEKELVWRGMATGTIDENPNMEKQQAKIDQVVEKILAQYPPK